MRIVYLGIGSNLEDREANLRTALNRLSRKVTIQKLSSVYETEPVGYAEQPWFLNLVCCGETDLDPFEILSFAKAIETEMGRKPSFPNAPRPIDVDLLFYEDRRITSEDLTVPHPRIAERGFVLIPLAEIAGSLIHPVNGKSITELLSELTDTAQIRKWRDVSSIGSASL